jgi:hypothetical protein
MRSKGRFPHRSLRSHFVRGHPTFPKTSPLSAGRHLRVGPTRSCTARSWQQSRESVVGRSASMTRRTPRQEQPRCWAREPSKCSTGPGRDWVHLGQKIIGWHLLRRSSLSDHGVARTSLITCLALSSSGQAVRHDLGITRRVGDTRVDVAVCDNGTEPGRRPKRSTLHRSARTPGAPACVEGIDVVVDIWVDVLGRPLCVDH